jgi:hypothetical protein
LLRALLISLLGFPHAPAELCLSPIVDSPAVFA